MYPCILLRDGDVPNIPAAANWPDPRPQTPAILYYSGNQQTTNIAYLVKNLKINKIRLGPRLRGERTLRGFQVSNYAPTVRKAKRNKGSQAALNITRSCMTPHYRTSHVHVFPQSAHQASTEFIVWQVSQWRHYGPWSHPDISFQWVYSTARWARFSLLEKSESKGLRRGRR